MNSTYSNEPLGSVWGNEALRHRLGSALRTGSLPHACILEGPEGTGKHTIARQIAAALVCAERHLPNKPIPCLSCRECRRISENKSPDLITVGLEEDKVTIGVETVRFLREDVRLLPNDSDHKIYIIENADRMTVQAQNALLLTLEEPPAYVHFILLCEHSGLLLETIRSRAPVFRTQPLTREQIAAYLCQNDRRAEQMKLADPCGFAELIAASGTGIGQALSYLDPKVYAPVKQNRELILQLTRAAVEKQNARTVLPLLLRFSSKRDALRTQLMMFSDAVRDLILLKKSDTPPLSFFADTALAIELCDRTSLFFLYRLYEAIRKALDENSANINIRLLLTKMAQDAELIT